jgi:hypothetical protein
MFCIKDGKKRAAAAIEFMGEENRGGPSANKSARTVDSDIEIVQEMPRQQASGSNGQGGGIEMAQG